MKQSPAFPTSEHEKAAQAIVEFFVAGFKIDAVMLTNSCARGKATRDSCLDMNVLVAPEMLKVQRDALEKRWNEFGTSDLVFKSLRGVGKYSEVHLDFIDGAFEPNERDHTSGPDSFEIEIGNALAYSVPLWQGSDYLADLERKWLPYYDETLRQERLGMVRYYCLDNLDHIPLYSDRGLYFQCFDRLYNAYREFLQALFITRRVYPIAYNKWIREQIEEILGLPELYTRLTALFEIKHFASPEIVEKAKEVEQLLDTYAPPP
jgi:predicted nucleotidyltransferase